MAVHVPPAMLSNVPSFFARCSAMLAPQFGALWMLLLLGVLAFPGCDMGWLGYPLGHELVVELVCSIFGLRARTALPVETELKSLQDCLNCKWELEVSSTSAVVKAMQIAEIHTALQPHL